MSANPLPDAEKRRQHVARRASARPVVEAARPASAPTHGSRPYVVLICCAGVLVLLLGVLAVTRPDDQHQTDLGVFSGSIETGDVDSFSTWLDRPVDVALTFPAEDSWADLEGPDWLLDPWAAWLEADPDRALVLSVPMLPGGGADDLTVATELQNGARGLYDIHFRTLAERLVTKGLDDVVLRIGWEANGEWFRWRASPDPEAWRSFFQRIVTVMRSTPGSNFTVDLTVAVPSTGASGAEIYPGDDYVDHLGVDVYDQSWLEGTYPYPPGASEAEREARQTRVWNETILAGEGRQEGLTFWADFAAEHDLRLSVPEWGLVDRMEGGLQRGGLDDPAFVHRMADWIESHDVAYQIYFDFDSTWDGLDARITNPDTAFPSAAEAFRARF